jgi:hypothetical protein
VHLGIDPEFSMKSEILPGKQIGTFDAKDINYASKYLSKLVKKYQLSPKILVVHRFYQKYGYQCQIHKNISGGAIRYGYGWIWYKRIKKEHLPTTHLYRTCTIYRIQNIL